MFVTAPYYSDIFTRVSSEMSCGRFCLDSIRPCLATKMLSDSFLGNITTYFHFKFAALVKNVWLMSNPYSGFLKPYNLSAIGCLVSLLSASIEHITAFYCMFFGELVLYYLNNEQHNI